MKLSDAFCEQARALIAGRLGLDFPDSRQAEMERGLVRALRASSISEPEAYLHWLAAVPDENPEWRRLAGHLTVGETYFFRDRAVFEALEQQVLPSLIAARRAAGILRLRLWSAGCATGEEAYSLAILLDRLLPDSSDWVLTILATDINPEALEAARRGLYRRWSFRGTPEWIRDRYFSGRGADLFELDPQIRRMVTFAPLNLAEDGYPSMVTNTNAMDLILCRNVLMYFTREAQRATAARLRTALVTGGWLAVSPAEASIELFHPLAAVNFPGAIFYRRGPVSIPVPLTLPSPPQGERIKVRREAEAERRSEEQAEAPVDTVTDLRRARALADRGSLEEARELCEAVLARDRLNPDAHLLLAAICQERGEIPAALGALRRTIYLAPDLAAAHFLLGSFLFRQGQPERGRRAMETVVRLLSPAPRDEPLPGGDGLSTGRLLDTARAYLSVSDQKD